MPHWRDFFKGGGAITRFSGNRKTWKAGQPSKNSPPSWKGAPTRTTPSPDDDEDDDEDDDDGVDDDDDAVRNCETETPKPEDIKNREDSEVEEDDEEEEEDEDEEDDEEEEEEDEEDEEELPGRNTRTWSGRVSILEL